MIGIERRVGAGAIVRNVELDIIFAGQREVKTSVITEIVPVLNFDVKIVTRNIVSELAGIKTIQMVLTGEQDFVDGSGDFLGGIPSNRSGHGIENNRSVEPDLLKVQFGIRNHSIDGCT